MHDGGDQARGAGNRHADEKPTVGLCGGGGSKIETGQPPGPADEKSEADNPTERLQTQSPPGRGVQSEPPHAPRIGQNRGRQSEGDDVGHRVELAAEVRRCSRHPGDSTVQPVEHHGPTDGTRRMVESFDGGLTRPAGGKCLHSAERRKKAVKTASKRADGKDTGQKRYAPLHGSARRFLHRVITG